MNQCKDTKINKWMTECEEGKIKVWMNECEEGKIKDRWINVRIKR